MSVPERPTDPSAPDAAASRLPLTDNPLFLAGKKDLAEAYDMATTIPDNREMGAALATVVVEEYRAGQRGSIVPDYFMRKAIATGKDGEPEPDFQTKAAEMIAWEGYPDISLGEWLKIPPKSRSHVIDQTIALAQAHAAVGADPGVIFSHLYADEAWPSGHRVEALGKLGQAQRVLGLTPPKEILDRIRDDVQTRSDDESRNRAISEAYALAGYPEAALQVLRTTTDNTFHGRSNALSLVTLSHAQIGLDPSQLISQAVDLTENMHPAEGYEQDYHPEWLQMENYAYLAQAAALAGMDPQPLIDRALKLGDQAPKRFVFLIAEGYTHVAKAQIKIGSDAKPTLERAVGMLDDLAVERSLGSWDAMSRLVAFEHIFNVQVAGGFFDEARTTIKKWEEHISEDVGFKIDISAMLAKLGGARMRAAMAS